MTQRNSMDFNQIVSGISEMLFEQGLMNIRSSTEAWSLMETHIGRAQIEILNGLIKVTEKRLEDIENQRPAQAKEKITVQ